MKRILTAVFALFLSVPVFAALKTDSGSLTGAISGNLNLTGNLVATGSIQASTWTVGGSTAIAQINVQNDVGNVLALGFGGSTASTTTQAGTPFMSVNISTSFNMFFAGTPTGTIASTSPSVAFSSAGIRCFMQYPSSSPAIFTFDQTQGYLQLFSTTSMSQYVKLGVSGGNNAIEFSAAGPDALLWARTGSLNLLSTNATKTVSLKAGTTGAFTIDAASGVVVGTCPVVGPRGSIAVGAGVYFSTQAAAPTAAVGRAVIYSTNSAAGGGAELFTLDASGNNTLISSHDQQSGTWVHEDYNPITGKKRWVNMDELVAVLEELSGRKIMYRTREEYMRSTGLK